MLLVHIGMASLRQFQCAPTPHVNSINEFFHHKLFSHISQLLFECFDQCNGHVERIKLHVLCSLACTWITIIVSQLYIIDSLSLDVSF